MALVPGSVTVDSNGNVTGSSGLAGSLFDSWAAAAVVLGFDIETDARFKQNRLYLAALCNAQALAICNAVDDADVVVLAGALDPGSPSVTRTLSGAVE